MSKDNSEYLIERRDNIYEVVIGLEVHAQVTSNSKLFSSSPTTFGSEPNTQVSLVDAAFPGMLPVINEYCVKQAIKTGIGLRAQINKRSVFDRKNYFYADLPQGYQISQFKYPIVGEGTVVLDMPNGQKDVGIEKQPYYHKSVKQLYKYDDITGIIIPGQNQEGDRIDFDPLFLLKHIRLLKSQLISTLPIYIPNISDFIFENITQVLEIGMQYQFDSVLDIDVKRDKIKVKDIAKKFDTPTYCYSYNQLKKNINDFKKNFESFSP